MFHIRHFQPSRKMKKNTIFLFGNEKCGISVVEKDLLLHQGSFLDSNIKINPDLSLTSSADFIFVFRSACFRKKLWKRFFVDLFPDRSDFKFMVQKITDHTTVLVLDNTISSLEIEDRIFWHNPELDGQKIYDKFIKYCLFFRV
jgi:hypothetical protein